MAFDGIFLQAISTELQNLTGSRIDKIYQPSKNCIIIGMYLSGKNYALQINIDSQNYSVFLTTHSKPNPLVAPNFCMLLRKYLLGLRIKNFVTSHLERILTIELEGFDDVDDLISYKLIIELMGKHCNILLVNEENIIIDCIRHISNNENENSKTRNLYPHNLYKYPIIEKLDFFDIQNFDDFYEKIYSQTTNISLETLPNIISELWNGISKLFIITGIKYLNLTKIDKESLNLLFKYIKSAILDSSFDFKTFTDNDNNLKDFTLIPVKNKDNDIFNLNYNLDDFSYNKTSYESLKNYKNSLLKIVLEILKQYKKRLYHMQEKLKECDNMEKYRIYGELITANLYRIKNINQKEISIENYYDENKLITIPLNEKYTPSENAKRFYKKYHKLKNTLEIVTIQKQETIKDLDYLESVIYELENCSDLNTLYEIYEEISENEIFKDKLKYKNKENKKQKKHKKDNISSFNPIKYIINGYTIYIGRNNKENDKLTLKFANKNDIWFHTKDIHGSHVILKLENNQTPNEEILLKTAQIAAFHSKGKNSSHVPVDYCEVKYVKKPNGSKPGMVIYSHNNTLYVEPQKEEIVL